MDLKQIKDLMAAMGRTGIRRLAVKKEKFELELEREVPVSEIPASVVHAAQPTGSKAQGVQEVHKDSVKTHDIPPSLHPPVAHPEMEKKVEGTFIPSPMVGTFYSSPGPDEPSFINVGDRVEKNTVVCIIEAMKVMNEVKAGVDGVVAEMLVENGHPVEFGTKLFRVS